MRNKLVIVTLLIATVALMAWARYEPLQLAGVGPELEQTSR